MSESREQDSSHNRDLSRIRWQHTVGTIVTYNLIGPVIEKSIPRIVPYDISKIEELARENQKGWLAREPNGVWACAFGISQHSMHFNPADHRHVLTDPALDEQFHQHTGLGSQIALEEGLGVQQIFPLNLAREVHLAATKQGVEGFAAEKLGDIAAILERPDFQALVLESAKTKQGIWVSFSNNAGAPFRAKANGIKLEFEFHGGGVAFTPEFSQFLRDQLREVNQQGLTLEEANDDKTKQPSGGCPAARVRPGFTKSPTDQQELAHLSQLLGKTPEELTSRYLTPERPPTIIHLGLKRTVEWLRATEPCLDTTQFDIDITPPEQKRNLAKRIFTNLLQQDKGENLAINSPQVPQKNVSQQYKTQTRPLEEASLNQQPPVPELVPPSPTAYELAATAQRLAVEQELQKIKETPVPTTEKLREIVRGQDGLGIESR